MSDSAKWVSVNVFSTVALVPGEVVRIAGNSQVAKSLADSLANATGTFGVALTPIGAGGPTQIVVAGKARVLLAAGLAPVAGQTLYVSAATTGRATVIAPSIAIAIGTIIDASTYATDGSVTADIAVTSTLVQGGGADWDPTIERVFLLSDTQGNDNNPGYVDGFSNLSPAIIPTRAVKTLRRFLALIPNYGNGRKFAGLIEKGDYTAEGDIVIGPYNGYALGPLFRGTCTDTTAGCTAFDNTVNDKLMAGFEIFPGTEVQGYRVSNVVTPGAVVDVVRESDGGAANLPVLGGVLGVRLRFDANTTTAGIRNFGTNISYNTASQISLGNNATGVAVGDILYLERAGVAIGRTIIQGIVGNGLVNNYTSLLSAQHARFAGLRFVSSVASGIPLQLRGNQAMVMTGIFTEGPSGATFSVNQTNGSVFVFSGYQDELGVQRRVGANRVVNGGFFFNPLGGTENGSVSNLYTINGLFSVVTYGGVINAGSANGVYNNGLSIIGTTSRYGLVVGSGGSANTLARPFRIIGTTAVTGIAFSIAGYADIRGVEFLDIAANVHLVDCNTPASSAFGGGRIDGISGAATGLGICFNLGNSSGYKWQVGFREPITMTAATPGREIVLSDGAGSGFPRYTFADIQTRRMTLRDAVENVLWGASNASAVLVDPIVGCNYAMGASAQFDMVRVSGDNTVTPAQANNAGNASNVVGVVISNPDDTPRARVVPTGVALVNYVGALSVPGVLYLSEATAGKVQSTVPGPGNQSLIVGNAVRDLGGGLCIAILNPELVPTAT